jgi:hypothetical protein
LDDQDFSPAAAFLFSALETDVDLLQLEGHPLATIVNQAGIGWKKSN